jgi:hypothetical protein
MYNFNLKRFINLLLPLKLRNNIIDFLATLLDDIAQIFAKFSVFRATQLKALLYNSQYVNFQRLLNDLYDSTSRRIRVYDAPYVEPIIVYPAADCVPVNTQITTSSPLLIIYNNSVHLYNGAVVELPYSFQSDTNKINQIEKKINTYKFAGVGYKIIYTATPTTFQQINLIQVANMQHLANINNHILINNQI